MAIDLDIRFTRPQLEAFNWLGRGRTVFLGWGRGTGKSHFLRTVCWLRVAQYDGKLRTDALQPFRGVRIAWLMPSRKQFVDVHGSAIVEELGQSGRFGFLGGKINRTTWEITFPGGSTLLPFPATDYNSQAARGVRADLVVVDECDDVGIEVYTAVAVPWLSATWSLGEEILAGTPTRGRHGNFFRMRQMGRVGARLRAGYSDPNLTPEESRSFSTVYASHATYADCPEVVSSAIVAKAKATTPPAIFAREWEADPDSAEGLVYPFDESFHVREPDPSTHWSEILIGCDHGYEDPGVFLVIGVAGSGRDAVAHVLEEVYEQHRIEDWWKAKLRELSSKYRALGYRDLKFYGDPSQPARLTALASCGVSLQYVDNSIQDGISAVANRLFVRTRTVGEGDDERVERYAHLFVSPSCRNTIREFGAYRRKRDPRNRELFLDDVEDRHNHALDAARYVIFNRFGYPRPETETTATQFEAEQSPYEY